MTISEKRTTGAETIRWDLTDLFSSLEDEAIASTLKQVLERAEQFERDLKGRILLLTSSDLFNAFQRLEQLLTGLYRVSQYSSLLYAIDTANEQIKAFELKIREESTRVQNLLVFFDLEIGCLSADQIQAHVRAPELKPYAYYLKRKHLNAQYDLSEPEEKLINLKDLTGSDAFKNMYEEVTASFRFEFELDGKIKTMTGEELRALRQHPNAEVRRNAMRMFFQTYQNQGLILGSIFNNIIKDYNIERKLRGYASSIAVQNVQNDLSDEAVAALHVATTESYVLVQRYYRIKAGLLNMSDMTLADIYAPLPQVEKEYSFADAKQLVLDAFRAFDEDVFQKALMLFTERRIDAPVAPGKRGGAFCSSSVPQLKPYVMLNFLGRIRDVSTLAHELGHAIHSMYSREQSLINFHAHLPLAETASVFSEMIVTEQLLKQEKDPQLKMALLTSKLEELFATSHRQNMFSRFEQRIHQDISDRLLSTAELCEHYRQELVLMFGNVVKIPEEYTWEWASIPHLVEMPFYVYAYNFANLLVMALFQQYKEEGSTFIPKYKKLLSFGSSASPHDITAAVGADIRHPEFWKKSFLLIEGFIDELEMLDNSEKKH